MAPPQGQVARRGAGRGFSQLSLWGCGSRESCRASAFSAACPCGLTLFIVVAAPICRAETSVMRLAVPIAAHRRGPPSTEACGRGREPLPALNVRQVPRTPARPAGPPRARGRISAALQKSLPPHLGLHKSPQEKIGRPSGVKEQRKLTDLITHKVLRLKSFPVAVSKQANVK